MSYYTRPTRAFINATEQYKITDIVETKSIYSHTHAYIYITQDNKTKEYKIFSKGTIYAENLLEITFQDTKHQTITDYIPIYKDSNIEISYSNIKLDSPNDVPKLKKLSFKPNAPDGKDCFYIKNEESLNKHIIEQEQISKAKYKPQVNDYVLKVACIIEDILGEIEDMYEEYHTSFKIAYAHNVGKINEIQKQNIYPYTVCNILDYFYLDEKREIEYKTNSEELKKIYETLAQIFLSDSTLLSQFFSKDSDITWILEKDKSNVADSYIAQLLYIDSKFFEMEYHSYFINYSKEYFNSGSKNTQSYIYLAQESATSPIFKRLYLNGGNAKFTRIKNDANLVLAHLIFTIFFSDEYENEISSVVGKIELLRKEFYKTLYKSTPIPTINSDSLKDVKKAVRNDGTVYWETMGALPEYKDKFLNEYRNLAFQNVQNSFTQDEKPLNITSKYLYYDKDFRFFKPENEKDIAKNIFEKIVLKLQDTKLKTLLKIYENVKNTSKFDYVISAMNIVYMLCECRTNLEVEAQQNNIFNPNLSHIYDFMKDLTKKRQALNEDQRTNILTDYNISESYINMFAKSFLFAVTYSPTYRAKAIGFTDSFKKNPPQDGLKKFPYKFVYEKEQSLKSQEREFYETMKNIEGYTSKVDAILEEIKSEEKKKYSIVNNSHTILKSFSNIFLVLKVGDFIIFNDNKTYKDCADFSKDITELSLLVGKVISSKGIKPPNELVEDFSKIIFQSNNPKRFLQNITLISRVAILTTIVTTVYDVNDLDKKEDYDALFMTLIVSGFSIAILFSPSSLLVGITLISMIILEKLKDSDLKIYLEKSLLFKKDISVIDVLSSNNKNLYTAPYLVETLKKDDKFKEEVKDGFRTSKKLIEFIGKNYLDNEILFNTALINELSFLKASLLGYKIERTKYRTSFSRRNDTNIYVETKITSGIKVPKGLAQDIEFKLLIIDKDKITAHNSEDNYKKFFELTLNNLTQKDDYYVFNPFQRDNNYFDLDEFLKYKLPRKIYTAYIIITSSVINLKYEVKYLVDKTSSSFISVNIEIDVDELEQISFNSEDMKLIEGVK